MTTEDTTDDEIEQDLAQDRELKQDEILKLAQMSIDQLDGEHKNKIFDGYHTFGELYDHRNLLWINFVRMLDMLVMAGPPTEKKIRPFWIRDHYPDWDLVVALTPKHGQISYHVHSKYRNLYGRYLPECPITEHEYDGHTSADVLKRLTALLGG